MLRMLWVVLIICAINPVLVLPSMLVLGVVGKITEDKT